MSSYGSEEESGTPCRSKRKSEQIDLSSVASSTSVVNNDQQIEHHASDNASAVYSTSTLNGFPVTNMNNINPISPVAYSNLFPNILPVGPIILPLGIIPFNNPFGINLFPPIPVTTCTTLPLTPVLPTPFPFPSSVPVPNSIVVPSIPSSTLSSSFPDNSMNLEATPSDNDQSIESVTSIPDDFIISESTPADVDDGQPVHDVWPIRHKYKALNGSIPSTHVCRSREHVCPHCGALLYSKELSRSATHGKFHKCCRNGDIQLPELPEVPEELKCIFRQPTYRAMSRKLNHALSFACWICHEDESLRGRYSAISSIRVQGCAYMTIGTIKTMDPSVKENFIQVFFNSVNEEEAIQKTARNANIDLNDKNREWLTTLHRWIRDNNPIYSAYQQTNDYVGDANKVNLIFTKHVPVTVEGDPRTYSDPNENSGVIRLDNELGVIIDLTHAECGVKYDHDIIIKKKGEGLSIIRSDHRLKEPLLYPLLFPHGTEGYGYKRYFHQRLSKRQDGTTYHKRITANEFLKYRLYRRGTETQDMHLLHGRLTQEWILSSYLLIEQQKLDFIRSHQKELKADKYKEVKAALATNTLGIAGKHWFGNWENHLTSSR